MSNINQNLTLQRTIAMAAVILLIVKGLAWWLTHSVAILTDALEGIVNVMASALGLYSISLSAKPKDNEHPYGHGKIEFISAGVEGMLISIAGLFIFYNAILSLRNPAPLEKLDVGILLIIFSGLVNYVLGRASKRMGEKNQSAVLKSSAAHLLSDVYSTIGLVAGLLLMWLTKIYWIDAVVAMIFAIVILYTGFKIIRSSVSGIMDEADEKLLGDLVEKLDNNRRTNWIDLHNMRIIKYGAVLHIDCHLTVPWYFNVSEAHQEVDIFSDLARNFFGESLELFVHSDACQPTSCAICQKFDCDVRKESFQKQIEWKTDNVRQNLKHDILT